jgi:sarcosine oxidase subunit gamma
VTAEERRSPLAAFADRFDAAAKSGNLRLTDLPFRTQLNLRVDTGGGVAAGLEAALGVPLPAEPNTVSATTAGSGDLTVTWLGPDEWLVLGPPDLAQEPLHRAVQEAAGDQHVSLVDVSAQRTTLLVAGPRARDLLAHGCGLDLHPSVFGPGRCAQTMLARAQVVLVAQPDGFHVLVRASFAAYLAEWLLDAATEYL